MSRWSKFKQTQQEHNNNNPIWGSSVFHRRGASTPLWGVESCSFPSGWPNPIPAFPPCVVRTPHLHGAPSTEETSIVNSDTNASNEKRFERNTRKKKRRNIFQRKNKKWKNGKRRNEKHESGDTLKWAIPEPPWSSEARKIFFHQRKCFFLVYFSTIFFWFWRLVQKKKKKMKKRKNKRKEKPEKTILKNNQKNTKKPRKHEKMEK